MSRRGPSGPGPLPVLLGLVVVLLAMGAFLFGAGHALQLAGSALSRTLVDGQVAHQQGATLQQLVLETGTGPGSQESGTCRLVHEGVAYPGHMRSGEGGVWWLELDSVSPLSGIRSLRIARADEPTRIAWKATLDMAGVLGLATARLEVAPVVLDGLPQGLRYWGEVVGPEVELLRGLHGHLVPVLDRPSGDPWATGAVWSPVGNAPGTTQAEARLAALLGLLHDRRLSDSLWTDSLSSLVDMDAFLRLRIWEDMLLNGRRVVPYLVAGWPSGRLYPLVGAFPRLVPDSLRSTGPTDRSLGIAGVADRYDRLRKEALDLLQEPSAWNARVHELAHGLAPHVARDRGARFILPGPGDVPVSTSVPDWRSAVSALLQRTPSDRHGP